MKKIIESCMLELSAFTIIYEYHLRKHSKNIQPFAILRHVHMSATAGPRASPTNFQLRNPRQYQHFSLSAYEVTIIFAALSS